MHEVSVFVIVVFEFPYYYVLHSNPFYRVASDTEILGNTVILLEFSWY